MIDESRTTFEMDEQTGGGRKKGLTSISKIFQ